MIGEITTRTEKAIREKVFPGCVVGIITHDKKSISPFGRFTYEHDSTAVKEDTVYDLASLTKIIATSSSLLVLVDRGDVKLDDKVVDFLPEFNSGEGKNKVLVKHLLTHTLDIDVPASTSLKDLEPKEIIHMYLKAPLACEPDTRFICAASTTLITSLLVERISKMSLDAFSEKLFFKLLGMKKTTFRPEKCNKREIPPTEFDEWRGRLIQGEVHDEVTHTLQNGGRYLGISGLFGTVGDLLIFLEMLLNKGMYKGKRYFSEKIVKEMHTNQLSFGEKEFGLGWSLNQKYRMGDLSSDSVFGHGGFTGTMVICDPVKNIAIVILSNRTFPKRSQNGDAINSFRRDIADIVFKHHGLQKN